MSREPKNKAIVIVVPFEFWQVLKEIAGEDPVEDVCESMLRAIVEDDLAAHQEAA